MRLTIFTLILFLKFMIVLLIKDYDENAYDDYFEVRRQKIERGEIAAPKSEDPHASARQEYEKIDWSWADGSDDYGLITAF